MVIGGVVGNLSGVALAVPVEMYDKIAQLALVLRAVGVAAILYVAYMVIMGILTYRRLKKVIELEKKADDIGKKVTSIDKRLDKLTKKN